MRYETLSAVKGWTALVSGILCLVFMFAAAADQKNEPLSVVMAVLFWVALIFGVSWYRQRRKMRLIEFRARTWHKKWD